MGRTARVVRMAGAGGGVDPRRLLRDAVDVTTRAVAAATQTPTARTGASGPAPPPLIIEKVRCEAAMLLRAATPVGQTDPDLRRALDALRATTSSYDPRELAVRLCLEPGNALDHALVPLHLRSLGHGEPLLEPLLADLFGRDRLRGAERPANRELEQHWLLAMWSNRPSDAETTRLLGSSIVGAAFDHLAGTTDDAYSFTHALLYATDHGRRAVTLPRPPADVAADAEGILAVALDSGNHDVAAESLWTWPLLGMQPSPLAEVAAGFLAEQCRTSGFLPGPGYDPTVHGRLAGPARDAYVLQTSYHTTLVHGLFLAASLERAADGPDRAQPAPRAAPDSSGPHPAPEPQRAVDALGAHLPRTARSAAWQDHVVALPGPTRELLGPALLTMALRRASTMADLPAIRAVLAEGLRHGWSDAPAARQAATLLRRAALCAGLTAPGPPPGPPPGPARIPATA